MSIPEFRRFSDLATVAAEPDWLWEGFLAAGQVTMLAGDAFSGKSTLVTGLLAAMVCGDRFLGRSTRRGTALLLSEETDQQLVARARRFGTIDSGHGVLTRTDGIAGCVWEELIGHATEHAKAKGHGVLVVDTFAGLAGLQKDEENDAGAVTKILRPLVVAGGKGLAVLVLHHTNKSGGVRGSQAFRATVDISVHLARSKHSNKLALSTESRHGDPHEGRLNARLDTTGLRWHYATPASERRTRPARRDTARDTILRALADAGPRGLTNAELVGPAGPSKSTVTRRMQRLRADGLVDRDGRGVRSDPHRWTPTTKGRVQSGVGGDATK